MMTKEQVLESLRLARLDDPETGHMRADDALLDYIDDAEIRRAYEEIIKCYS